MSTDPVVTPAAVESLCRAANLPISKERQARLAPLLAGWIAAANELSAIMARRPEPPSSIPPVLRFPER